MLISVWYALEGNYEMAVVSAICALPYVGSMVGGTAGLAIQFVGYGMTLGMGIKGTTEAVDRAVESYKNGTLGWWNALDIGVNALTVGFAGAALYSVGNKLSRIGALGDNGGYINLGEYQGRNESGKYQKAI